MPETTIKAWKRDATILHIVGFVMIMLRVGGLLIGRQAGGAAGWDQGQVTEHRTANGNPLFLLPSFATSTLCVCMCKTCPSYLSMLTCASNKTNSWKGLVSYCYFGKKCIGNFWNMPFVADCIFSFFLLWIWFFNSPCWWVSRLARGQTQIARLNWSKWLWRRGEVMWRTWPSTNLYLTTTCPTLQCHNRLTARLSPAILKGFAHPQ